MPPRPRKTADKKPEAPPNGDAPQDRLSPGAENYLLCLYRLWEDDESPTITQLTDELRRLPSTEGLGTSVPSVAGMVRRMARQQLIEIGGDKRIRLTRPGMAAGEDIARRHRLAEWMVVSLLGMELHQAHTEAHRLEHGMSAQLIERLAERLHHPRRSPYGRPIPGTGEPRIPPNAVTLDAAEPGISYVVERVPEEDSQLLQFLSDSEIVPEKTVTIAGITPFLGVMEVATGQGQVSMGFTVARQIVVRPA